MDVRKDPDYIKASVLKIKFRNLMTIIMFLRRSYHINFTRTVDPAIQRYNILSMEGTLDCNLNWYPKFYNSVGFFVGSKNLVAFLNF